MVCLAAYGSHLTIFLVFQIYHDKKMKLFFVCIVLSFVSSHGKALRMTHDGSIT